MINFQNSIISLKATSVRRLNANQNCSKPLWIELFEKIYNTNIAKFTNFGTFYPVILKKGQNTYSGKIHLMHRVKYPINRKSKMVQIY